MAIRNQPKSLGGTPIQIDYTARDYEAIRNELLTLASQLTPEWTDRQPGDIGVTFMEAISYVSDILSYQLDRAQNESYLATAQTRESVVNILRLIGYELKPATPATVEMSIRTTQNNVTLTANTFKVSTEGNTQVAPLEYTLSENTTLAAAGLHENILFIAGTPVTEIITSIGGANQAYLLNQSPICLDSNGIQVTVGNVVYEGKTSFLGVGATDNVFVYKFLSSEEVIIQFGDGITGTIPAINSSITVSYRINGGEETNRAGIQTINQFTSVIGVSEVFNAAQPSGGADPESLISAKKNGPLSLRALDRCVTLEDFETMAKLTPSVGIRAARAIQGDSPLEVNVYVATEGDNPIPSGEWYTNLQNGYGNLGAVGRWLNDKKPVPTILSVYPPVVVNPYFEATVYVYPNLLKDTVEADVDTSLQVLFNNVTDDFGEGIPLSLIMQAIENTRGVDYVNATAFYRLPTMRWLAGNKDSFSGSVLSVTNVNKDLIRDTYLIEWLNSSTYRLKSIKDNVYVYDQNGSVQNFTNGTTNIVSKFIVEANGDERQYDQFEITVTVGNTSASFGDVWEFSLDDYLGNIIAQPHEIISSPIQANGRLDSTKIVLTYEGGI